jgi:hypothetical protein
MWGLRRFWWRWRGLHPGGMAGHGDVLWVGLAARADQRGPVRHMEVELTSDLLSCALAGEGQNSIGNPSAAC